MIRSFIPLDVVDLLVARGRLSNRVKTKDSIGKKDGTLNDLANILGDWFNPRFRPCVWVYAEGLTLRGLASVKDRCSPHAWEIDRLLIGEEDHNSCLKLLEHLGFVGGQLGIGRIFLRLPNDSLFLKDAEQTGFVPYSAEHLYWMERADCGKADSSKNASTLSPRRKRVGDDYQLFELYLRCVPVHVRRAEGMTYKEWQSNRSRAVGQEWVFEKDGSLVGWMAICAERGRGQIDLIAANKGEINSIVEYGLTSLLGSSSQLFCLAPDFEGELLRVLEYRGFCRVTTYCALMKELVVRAAEPCVMPAVPA